MPAYVTDAIHADAVIEDNHATASADLGHLIYIDREEYTRHPVVTVRDSDITLETAGKWLANDLIIQQGIPLYTGATSFTIVDSGLTIATNGKRLNSNITVDISALETLAEEISEVVG